MIELTAEQEDYIMTLSACDFDAVEAYKRTHKTTHLSKEELNERAMNAYIWAVGDLLKERWGVLDTE